MCVCVCERKGESDEERLFIYVYNDVYLCFISQCFTPRVKFLISVFHHQHHWLPGKRELGDSGEAYHSENNFYMFFPIFKRNNMRQFSKYLAKYLSWLGTVCEFVFSL